ncbi:MAG: phage scaffolding protein [Candidatus Hodarchaeales archaeon]
MEMTPEQIAAAAKVKADADAAGANVNPDGTQTPTPNPDEVDPSQPPAGKKPGNEHVPLWKFQKEVKKAKDLVAELAGVKTKLTEATNNQVVGDDELKSQLDEMTNKSEKLASENLKLKESKRNGIISNKILAEINKHNPHNSAMAAKFIDLNELGIDDSGDDIIVNGVEDVINKLKETDPYLFKAKVVAKPEGVDLAENGKPVDGSGGSIETEFQELIKKSKEPGGLTQPERVKLRGLGIAIKKLRKDNENKE